MWPLIIGAVSQATDPAKKLADDYCAYVISQGGEVDYATVYGIYKNELLVDPDKDKMIFWGDFRLLTSNNKLFSLIYPYVEIRLGVSTIENGEFISGLCYYNIYEELNPCNGKLKVLTKLNRLSNTLRGWVNLNYSIDEYAQFSLRNLTYQKRSYLSLYDDLGNTIYDILYSAYVPFGEYTVQQIFDLENRIHSISINESVVSSSIQEGFLLQELRNTDSRIYSDINEGLLFIKYYKL